MRCMHFSRPTAFNFKLLFIGFLHLYKLQNQHIEINLPSPKTRAQTHTHTYTPDTQLIVWINIEKNNIK